MAPETRISPRERLVLNSIVEHYIETGEPVSSQSVARDFASRNGMSAATIRNVMAALAESGLVEQPHTSAGRIPTPRAFRFYVEQLGLAAQRPLELSTERRAEIDENFSGIHTSQQFLERTSHVLALLSSGVGIAFSTMKEAHALEHIHFSRLAPNRVLAVVVTLTGVVLDRMLLLDKDLGSGDLEICSRYLNENFHGWPIDSIRTEVNRRLEAERSEYDRILLSLKELQAKGALDDASGVSPEVYVEGVGNLLSHEEDRERLRVMLSALETKQRLIDLLTAYLDARQKHVRVIVGLEDAMPEMGNLVLIGAPARVGEESLGTVAVLGSTRIHYQETIDAVSYIAQLSTRLLQPPQ
ncbi:MAG: heat-inducible transcriptional repressor HrcA [Acidobacteriaceae bacterium]